MSAEKNREAASSRSFAQSMTVQNGCLAILLQLEDAYDLDSHIEPNLDT